jgi:hypothetical protein
MGNLLHGSKAVASAPRVSQRVLAYAFRLARIAAATRMPSKAVDVLPGSGTELSGTELMERLAELAVSKPTERMLQLADAGGPQ